MNDIDQILPLLNTNPVDGVTEAEARATLLRYKAKWEREARREEIESLIRIYDGYVKASVMRDLSSRLASLTKEREDLS